MKNIVVIVAIIVANSEDFRFVHVAASTKFTLIPIQLRQSVYFRWRRVEKYPKRDRDETNVARILYRYPQGNRLAPVRSSSSIEESLAQ